MAVIRFWQRMVSPHIFGLAVSLASRGHEVEYIAEQFMAPERSDMGWDICRSSKVKLRIAGSRAEVETLVSETTPGRVNVTQGFRSNGLIRYAQRNLRSRGEMHFVIMETLKCRGPIGQLKKVLYAQHLRHWTGHLDGILAIGHTAVGLLAPLSPSTLPLHQFAYFLPTPLNIPIISQREWPFRFLFVGRLIKLKRVDLLINALARIGRREFELEIVGSGPEMSVLKSLAEQLLPGRVRFLGTLPISEVSGQMARADCLVLPSWHDGWGAVISEAMIVGTPVICSSACGAAGSVIASKRGGVFKPGDCAALSNLLRRQLEHGMVSGGERSALREWACCLDADSGALYFERILASYTGGTRSPPPPWLGSTNLINAVYPA